MDTLEQAKQHFLRALEQQRIGQFAAAEKLYREALTLAPDRVSVLVNLGAVLLCQRRFAESLRYSERALALEPDQTDALLNAAECRRQLLGERAALDTLDHAVAQQPEDAAALNNRGVVHRDAGRLDEALADFSRALALRPDAIGTLTNHGSVLAELDRADEALASFVDALRRDPQFLPAQEGLFELFAAHPALALRTGAAVEALALRAVSEPWGRPRALVPFLIARLRAGEAWARSAPEGPTDADTLRAMQASPVLRALLLQGPIPDPVLEARLVQLRADLLRLGAHPAAAADADPARLELHAALARQCFINEYVYPASMQELATVYALRTRLAEAARDGQPVDAAAIAAFASHAPLSQLPGLEQLQARPWPDAIGALFRQQVQAPAEEQRLAAGIGKLTPIEDDTSRRVQEQYEAHPYPRWVALPARREAQSLAAHLAHRLPGLSPEDVPRERRLTALIAGCGTGQQPIETAQSLLEVEVLAIDLSRASLAYAKRMARELGIANLRFAQADLLALGRSDLHFDLIESSGVLHHLAEPWRGLAALVGMLRPGGVLRLGLYSERARRAVVAARAHIAAQGYAPHAQGIRACRRDILAAAPDSPLHGVLAFNDFYALSECRDLLFHVQEHRFDLPRIAEAMQVHRLQLLGFELDPARRRAFEAMFPNPDARRDFAAWDRFEAAHPDAFAGMYQFWLRKPG
jgi:Tfp pilus assembly protein PilF/SAM-dependent methyltransferase